MTIWIIKLAQYCAESKPVSDFYSQKKHSKKRGDWIYYNPECKECTKSRSTNWLHENKDKRAIMNSKYHKKVESKEAERIRKQRYRKEGKVKEWQEKNKDRLTYYNLLYAEHKKHEISEDEWISCKEYFNQSCAYCGLKEEKHRELFGQQLHREHVINKGANDLSNCVPSCRICNSEKHDRDFDYWYINESKHYSLDRYNKVIQWLNEDYIKYLKINKSQQYSN